jgi:hypothetical protein
MKRWFFTIAARFAGRSNGGDSATGLLRLRETVGDRLHVMFRVKRLGVSPEHTNDTTRLLGEAHGGRMMRCHRGS